MSNFMYDQRVLYLNLIISSLIVSVYLALKWPKLKKLSDQDTSLTIERWSLHFSVEIVNQLVGLLMVQLISTELTQRLFQYERSVSVSSVLTAVAVILLLDFVFYWRHRFYHRYLMLLHGLHHRDQSFDLTVSLRIHPIEAIVQILLFLSVVGIFGLDRWQMMTINIVFTVQALYSHLELDFFPEKVNYWLSGLFVLPHFHNVHHNGETSAHYGFLFSIWDRFFGTLTKDVK